MNKYQKAFSQHAEKRDSLFNSLDKIAVERITTRPPSGAWSSQEVLHHLFLSESGTLHVLKKQLAKETSTFKNISLVYWVRSWLLNSSLLSNRKFKAPTVVSNLENLKSYEELKAEWKTFKAGMENLLANLPRDIDKKLIFKHPIAGWLTLKGTLQFLRFHQMHHARQIVERAGVL